MFIADVYFGNAVLALEFPESSFLQDTFLVGKLKKK
jgi:hypothetical protein